ncbi:hypothetical protein HK405_001524, partial [Cladochytrium tenue]
MPAKKRKRSGPAEVAAEGQQTLQQQTQILPPAATPAQHHQQHQQHQHLQIMPLAPLISRADAVRGIPTPPPPAPVVPAAANSAAAAASTATATAAARQLLRAVAYARRALARPELAADAAVVDRLAYKNANQHRRAGYFRKLIETRRLLRRLAELQLDKLMLDVLAHMGV